MQFTHQIRQLALLLWLNDLEIASSTPGYSTAKSQVVHTQMSPSPFSII